MLGQTIQTINNPKDKSLIRLLISDLLTNNINWTADMETVIASKDKKTE